MHPPRTLAAAAGIAAASVVLAACGSDKKDSSSSTPAPAAAAPASSSSASGGGLTVAASEYKFGPATLTAKAGKVKITMKNAGKFPHELVVLKTTQDAASLKVTGGRVSEKDSVGEIGDVDPGSSKSTTLDLKPGHYDYLCNIPGHYMQGMRGTLTVT